MTFPGSTTNVHKLCSKVQETWRILCIVLSCALIYTGQKKHWMFGTGVEIGWFHPSLSQINWSTISQKTTTTTKKFPKMCSPSLKGTGVVGGLLNTSIVYSITIFSIEKHSAIYS